MALKPRQMALIEAIITHPRATYVELGEMIGANKNTVAAWKRLPEFQEELSNRIKEVWKDGEAAAIQNMQKLADEGNFNANKYILDSLGYAPAQRIEANVKETVIEVSIDEQD